ncbi:ZPR1 zinc finger domain-containing protein [Acidianus sp. RZ1]|uniref:ZPR1 zinc finger domain-containing protein n=1 Tax=Acidianus sp. RZ1 TaxID=1540082 RepID=UPI001492A7DC|nr:ZPR1 zinc finger domain-containing protein [Acidianus sp. RZ1]NON61226.1 ZPR1 zinc finger domain-containing protein [Acidianus sp. RZ1]
MEPKLIFDQRLKCPICGMDTLLAKDYLYDAGEVGEMVLSNWECENCHYRYRDVKPYEHSHPKRLELSVENEEDLNIIVYRSPFGNLIIPELSIEVISKDVSQGSFTTVEGILDEILENLGSLCDNGRCQDIKNAKDGKKKFTLIIEDTSGTSFIKSKKTKITQLLSLSPELQPSS